MKYIDADKLKAEIDRRYQEYRAKMKTEDFTYYEGMADALDLFEQFLDTLSEEPVSEDLEEEVKNYFEGYWPGTDTPEQCNTDLHFTPPAILRLARHFSEWQKEQMMKGAVEGVIIDSGFDDGIAFVTMNIPDRRYDRGDKVRIIVLKAEEE